MLKDFLLLEDSGSCSSSGFKSFPRFPSSNANSPKLLEDHHRASRALGPGPPLAKLRRSRSRSRSAAEAAIAALQKLLTSVKSPSSSKKKPTEKKDAEEFARVRVKDILRWRSFRGFIDGLDEEEKALPLDCFPASPNGRSRLDASVGPSREWEGVKRNVGGEDPMMAGTGTELRCCDYVGTSEDEYISNDDEEQHSPVSILDSPFRDDEDSAASFDESLANVERTKQRLLESIKWLETLAGVKSIDSDEEDEIDGVIEEPTTEAKTKSHHRCKDEKLEAQGTKEAKANLGCKKESEMEECVREMEKDAQWSRFEEQTNQLGTELGLGMLNALIDELLVDLVGRSD